MTRIHVLSPGFDTPNGRAFLFPLMVWWHQLFDHGFEIEFFRTASPDICDCDALMIDGKAYAERWPVEMDAALAEIEALATSCRVIFCDTSDSSGTLQTEVLPIVDVYAKGQLLRDRSAYLRPLYGHRSYTDYYHRVWGVNDTVPEWSAPVENSELLEKLLISWNSGLADYSLFGPARMAAYHRVPLTCLLQYPRQFVSPSVRRPNDVSCRFGLSHPRATIAVQRRRISQIRNRGETSKLSRIAYFNELKTSKVVVSPFGYGEITLKDFEVFITGGLLLKPDMSELETWPDLFRSGQTMISHAWDLSDFDGVLEHAIRNHQSLRDLAERGQDAYRDHTIGADAAAMFCTHFSHIVQSASAR